MTGPTATPSLLQRQPIAAATGITGVVTAVLATFWSIAGDEKWLTGLTPNTVLLVNGTIIIIATFLANWWAQSHSTATAAPVLPSGTTVKTVDANGAAGTTTV